jgi:Rrf2 family nitric oxide-sensitive transcriptional repressor
VFFTRQTDYGLRIMMALGLEEGRRLTAAELAKRVGVSRPFVQKIVRALRAAGLVDAQRGVGGGVALAKEPAAISVRHIACASHGPRGLNPCLVEPRACSRSRRCAAHRLLQPIQQRLDAELDALTLDELVREQRALNKV